MMDKLTRQQAAIIGAYTGILCGPFEDMAVYAQTLLGRPIYTHQYPDMADEISAKAKADFVALAAVRA